MGAVSPSRREWPRSGRVGWYYQFSSGSRPSTLVDSVYPCHFGLPGANSEVEVVPGSGGRVKVWRSRSPGRTDSGRSGGGSFKGLVGQGATRWTKGGTSDRDSTPINRMIPPTLSQDWTWVDKGWVVGSLFPRGGGAPSRPETTPGQLRLSSHSDWLLGCGGRVN